MSEPALPSVLYHGTSTKWLGQILRQGLQPCSMTGAVLMTCLGDDRGLAEYHALHQAECEDADPVVFAIPIERLDVSMFTLEDKFVELGPSNGRGVAAYHAMERAEPGSWETRDWTWREMLAVAGAVGYTGAIPVTEADLERLPPLEREPGEFPVDADLTGESDLFPQAAAP